MTGIVEAPLPFSS